MKYFCCKIVSKKLLKLEIHIKSIFQKIISIYFNFGIQCRGGTAGCGAFVPEVVQCYNRGSDGLDVQWECKTDMDNKYRFGKISVSCEGYDYPDDPYILAGSCGLDYTIDRVGNSGNFGNSNPYSSYQAPKSTSTGTFI